MSCNIFQTCTALTGLYVRQRGIRCSRSFTLNFRTPLCRMPHPLGQRQPHIASPCRPFGPILSGCRHGNSRRQCVLFRRPS